MAFKLKTDQSVADGICRAARAQIKRAGRDLAELPADSAVHEIRKRFKRIRALARLARKSLGRKSYQRSNEQLRDAGKPLAQLRDGKAIMRAIEKFGRTGHIAETSLQPLRDGLKGHYDSVYRQLTNSNGCDVVAAALKKARKLVRHWKIDARGWQAFRSGLSDTYGKAQAALSTALVDPTIANLHEWRKQSKYLWNQVEFIWDLRPRALNRLADKLHRLCDLLGDDHDLAVLAQLALAKQQEWNAVPLVERMLPLVWQRRERLQRKAFRLGERLFQNSPEEFVAALKREGRRRRVRATTGA